MIHSHPITGLRSNLNLTLSFFFNVYKERAGLRANYLDLSSIIATIKKVLVQQTNNNAYRYKTEEVLMV